MQCRSCTCAGQLQRKPPLMVDARSNASLAALPDSSLSTATTHVLMGTSGLMAALLVSLGGDCGFIFLLKNVFQRMPWMKCLTCSAGQRYRLQLLAGANESPKCWRIAASHHRHQMSNGLKYPRLRRVNEHQRVGICHNTRQRCEWRERRFAS